MNIISFSPHPDDAELSMGGTIAKYTKNGHKVLIVVVTIPNNKKQRKKEAEEATKILGADLLLLDLHPSKLHYDRQLICVFDSILKQFPPDVIYSSWIHDSHQDHLYVSQASIASARKNTCSFYMCKPAYPAGITCDAFHEQSFMDISDTIEDKMRSVYAHKSQVEYFGETWVEGIKARAAYMGAFIGAKYAEVFEVVKEIQRVEKT